MSNIYKKKSLERLEIAKISEEKQLFYSLASNLYFAVFNYMQSILIEPPDGKWKHLGILSHFSRYCIENRLFSQSELKTFSYNYKELYELRRKSDYLNLKFDEEDKVKLAESFMYFENILKR